MATSGSFNTNKVGDFYCTVSWSRTGYNATKNEHYISYKVVAHNAAGKYRSVYTKELTINNTRVYYNTTSSRFYDGDTMTSGSMTIKSSNSSGDGSISMSFAAGVGTSSGTNISGSKTWSLNRIPRYASLSQTVSSKTETTITMSWSSDSTCDYVWYSVNNQQWVQVGSTNSTSGSYTISGLSANTSYNIRTSVRRKDSQLDTNSSNLSVATYAYPYANSMPSFTIGNTLTIGIYNPLGRSVQITIIGADNTEYGGDTISGTSISGYVNDTWQNWWYSTIPNSKSGTYKVKVTYGNIITTKTGGTYSVNENVCIPEAGTFAYRDTNASTIAISGNNQLIIQNNSTVQITIASAQAKKSATLATASININGRTISGSFAAGSRSITFNVGTINVANNISIPITVTDSRGISATKNLDVQILSWSLPTAIINLERVANYYSTTNILVNADYSSLNNNNTITIQYQIKKVTDTNYGSLVTIQDNVQAQFEANNLYEWNVRVILTDRLGSTTYNLKLSKGIPIVFFDNFLSSTGFNCFPKDEESVEVNGINILKYVEKNVMTRSLSAPLTNLVARKYTIIPLNLTSQIGEKLTATNDGGIQIGENVSKILVSANMGLDPAASSGSRHVRIVKNNTDHSVIDDNTLGWSFTTISSGNTASISINPQIVDIETNDIIYLVYYTEDSNDRLSGHTHGGRTSITVEVMK